MLRDRSCRVGFDGEAFLRHTRSGVTRYFAELLREYADAPALGVVPVTPYRFVASEHLVDRVPGRYRRVPLPGRVRYPLLARANARRLRRRGEVDLVHHSIYEPAALDLWPDVPRVCTVYDFSMEVVPESFGDTSGLLAAKADFLARADVLVCISDNTEADLHRFHPALRQPVVVTHLAASEEFFDPRPATIRGLPERYLLYVGNRHPHKNADVLFRAFARIHRSFPDVALVLTGAWLPDEPARLAELGIDERVVTLRATDAQLPWLYHRAEAFVFPSRYEGFGLPVVEAMAAGCPVLVADTPALVEVAGDAAGVFGVDDDEALADLLGGLLTGPGEGERLRAAGRERAAQFTWRRTAEATARAYQLALDG